MSRAYSLLTAVLMTLTASGSARAAQVYEARQGCNEFLLVATENFDRTVTFEAKVTNTCFPQLDQNARFGLTLDGQLLASGPLRENDEGRLLVTVPRPHQQFVHDACLSLVGVQADLKPTAEGSGTGGFAVRQCFLVAFPVLQRPSALDLSQLQVVMRPR